MWSFRLMRLTGIEIRVHATFLLLLAFLLISQVVAGDDWSRILSDTGFFLILFATIILHELGHALMARRFGSATKRIVLLPIGGVAELEKMPEKPGQELLVALAGPAVNIGLAGLTVLLAWIFHWPVPTQWEQPLDMPFWVRFAAINVMLAAFNLLPAFPMDGGRVLRASLAFWLPRPRATRIAALVGRIFALIFGWIGLFSNPLLVLIAVFVWFGAGAEAKATDTHEALKDIRVGDVMVSEFHVLQVDDPLGVAVGHILDGFQAEFLVFEHGNLVGILGRDEVLRGLAEYGDTVAVGQVVRRDFVPVFADEDMQQVTQRLTGQAGRTMPVLKRHSTEVIGMLTLDNLGDYLVLQRAMAAGGRRHGRALIADRVLTRRTTPMRTEL